MTAAKNLRTERLLMRPYCPDDAAAIFSVVSRREIAATTVLIPHPYPRATVDWWIRFTRENIENGSAYEYGLFLIDDEGYIGNCGLINISSEHRNAEFAYFIDPRYWGRGYATEAAKTILTFGFDELGLERIYGRCMSKNIASRRVMEKIGLKYEGTTRHEVCKWGEFEDVDYFGLISSERK